MTATTLLAEIRALWHDLGQKLEQAEKAEKDAPAPEPGPGAPAESTPAA